MKTKLLLADDHKMVRDGLRALIEKDPGIEILGEALNGSEAVRLAAELSPDVVVMDVGMPDLNGIEATRQIKEHNPKTQVIALSMHAERHFVTEMLSAGARAYVLKDAAFNELAEAIAAVRRGRLYLSPEITDLVITRCLYPLDDGVPAKSTRLTPREREVLQLLADGRNAKQIAGCLDLSVNTVDTHRRRIMKKLGLFSVAELTKYAIREGLTTLE